jgi:exonuclease V gamma subunit
MEEWRKRCSMLIKAYFEADAAAAACNVKLKLSIYNFV